MSITEIQNKIISKVKSIEDAKFLNAVYALLSSNKKDEELYQFTPEQLQKIEKGREDIKNGRYKEHDDFIKEIESWLKEG